MADVALGKITTNAGVPVKVTGNLPNPDKTMLCHSYLIEVLPTNTGKVYIGDRPQMNKTTFEGVLAWLPPPTTNSAPSYTVTISNAPNGLSVQNRYIDVDVNGDGVIVSVAIN
jgi:hypothetical protein